MRVAALISGGKDSALAYYRAAKMNHKVEFFVTMYPEREDSWMFHVPNIHLADLVAQAAEIPLAYATTSGLKEEERQDLQNLLATLDVEGVISGVIASRYQYDQINRICRELNLVSITPLWQEDPTSLIKEIISLNFHTIIVGVYGYGFSRNWIGRRIDLKTLEDLIALNSKWGISIVGEGGEYETLVLDAPFYQQRIHLINYEKVWSTYEGTLIVKNAKLVEKAKKVY